ncbi:hypothetical protein MHU86_10202 [Fragilaria crotonensis]|nr:hypothetical protein MHU86_10202 [Fragilaria crotonensis]
MNRIFATFLLLLLAIVLTTNAFVLQPPASRAATVRFEAHSNRLLDLTAIVAITASSPFVALAEEADGYEYGAVDAPIGIAVVGGVLAVLTALLPLLLKGGEEAFEDEGNGQG